MKLDALLRSGLALYILAGYVSAYYYAKRSMVAAKPERRRSALARAASWAFIILMPICAISALSGSSDIPFVPLLIGASMNVFWFYAGCLGLLRGAIRVGFDLTDQKRS